MPLPSAMPVLHPSVAWNRPAQRPAVPAPPAQRRSGGPARPSATQCLSPGCPARDAPRTARPSASVVGLPGPAPRRWIRPAQRLGRSHATPLVPCPSPIPCRILCRLPRHRCHPPGSRRPPDCRPRLRLVLSSLDLDAPLAGHRKTGRHARSLRSARAMGRPLRRGSGTAAHSVPQREQATPVRSRLSYDETAALPTAGLPRGPAGPSDGPQVGPRQRCRLRPHAR